MHLYISNCQGRGKGPSSLQTRLHGARKRALLDLQGAVHSHGGTPIAGWFIRIVYGKNPIKMDDFGAIYGNLYIWRVCG